VPDSLGCHLLTQLRRHLGLRNKIPASVLLGIIETVLCGSTSHSQYNCPAQGHYLQRPLPASSPVWRGQVLLLLEFLLANASPPGTSAEAASVAGWRDNTGAIPGVVGIKWEMTVGCRVITERRGYARREEEPRRQTGRQVSTGAGVGQRLGAQSRPCLRPA
jgi:hypothetical protein